MNMKLEKEYLKEMIECREKDSDDPETAHNYADGILCELLEKLGYNKIVDEYHKIEKWYS